MSRSLSVIEKKIYNGVLSRLKSDEADSAGRRKITIKNRMGILHARFGFYKPAEKEFMECIGASPEYSPAYMNLINLYTLSGKRSDLNRIMAMIKNRILNWRSGSPKPIITIRMNPPFPGHLTKAEEHPLSGHQNRLSVK